METALSLYADHEKIYPPHVLAGVTGNQIEENKGTLGAIMETMKKVVKFMSNAQVKPKTNA